VNENGGINGRKINLISLDDAYSPPKTMEQIRRLVESDEVLKIFPVARNGAKCGDSEISQQKKIPHLFVSSGVSRFNDPADFRIRPGGRRTMPRRLASTRRYSGQYARRQVAIQRHETGDEPQHDAAHCPA
jgi:hypothetical protein